MANPFDGSAVTPSGPAKYAEAPTLSDSTDLTNIGRALFVGTGGDIVGIPAGQSTAVTFKNVPGGMFSVVFKRIYSTGTTATNLLVVW